MQLLRHFHSIEILESRIAPAAVTLSFFDQDGKAVSVTSTKGTVADLQTAVGVASGATATGVLSFQFGTVFKGADITVVAGANAADAITTQVGFVNAAGVDLGKLTIDGELDRINAGDNISATAALKSINVRTWGNANAPTSANQFDSEVIGAITSLTVQGDFTGGYLVVRGTDSFDPLPSLHVTDVHGKIGTLFIGGSLVGTARDDGGHIFATGDIGKVTITGSVVGFKATVPPTTSPADQDSNARIFSRGAITSLLIGTDATDGNIVGGDGAFSGQIVGADGIGKITVKGNIQGGLGLESGAIGAAGELGAVTVTKNLTGGAGDRSGTILGFTTITSVTIGGNIQGGDGVNSGAIGVGSELSSIPGRVQIGTVKVGGSIIGGDGASSGQIVSQGTIKNVTVEGSLVGGSQFETGAIGSLKGLGAIVIKGDIVAGTGTRSGLITTEEEPVGEGEGEGPDPGDANAPIASVTVLGSIIGTVEGSESFSGYRAGGILASGQLGPVVIGGDVIGGNNHETGRIASSHGIASVKIGGHLKGGQGNDSGSILAETTLGAVSIGDESFEGSSEVGFSDTGVIGGDGVRSGSVIGRTLSKIDVYGELRGGLGAESGTIQTFGSGAAGKMGNVYVRGSVLGGSGTASVNSGSIISSGAITSVKIGTSTLGESNLIGGGASESGNIISALDLGAVYIEGSINGGSGADSGRISSEGKIASVYVGFDINGGGGDGSGSIQSTGNLGPVAIGGNGGEMGGDIIGGDGESSGSVISGGKLAKIDVFGSVLGGDGPASGRIETQGEGTLGDMGPVFIAGSLIGSFGSLSAVDSGQIFSSGKITSVVIGDPKVTETETESGSGSVTGGIARGSGSISSELDMGPVKIKANLAGGTGDESGKITSGAKIASLTIGAGSHGGSIIGGSGNYDTTVESGDQLGQVYAEGAIGAVIVFGNVTGNTSNSEGGSYSGQVSGLSIASITVHGNVSGGLGFRSGGFVATSLNIGPVVISGNLEGGEGSHSGFISAEGNISSVKIGASLLGGEGSGSGYVAAGQTLGSLEAAFASGSSESSRPRISAGDSITSVTISESIFNTDILAGYNTDGIGFNPDAQIGTVKIGTGTGPGHMQGTNIVAGIGVGSDGKFGTFDDVVFAGSSSSPAYSKIASVIVKGTIEPTDSSGDSFGILAENLVSLKVGGSTLSLASGALNDSYKLVSLLSDTYYGEIFGTIIDE